MTILVNLSDECLEQLADAVAARMASKPQTKSLTIREFADAISISEQSVRRRIKSGAIRAAKMDGIVRIPSSEIHRFLGA